MTTRDLSTLSPTLQSLESLRNVFSSAGFTPDDVLATIGVKDAVSIKESDILLLMDCTKGGTPLHTLIRLFLIEVPVAVAALRQAIAPMTPEEWAEIGLVEVRGDSATAKLKLFPYLDMVMAYDPPKRLLTDEGEDYVMGIGGSSLTLANLTVRRQSGLTLDLGTGCGFQAFMAARHSERVIAVDRNPRAVALTAFNARLNGLANVECREGDLFAPVERLTFDLIVSNPPFVISPESRYIYRDSGMVGDEVCRRIVREAPGFLNEGGFCQVLCNWAEYDGRDWRERLREWFDGSGCDVWVMRNQSRDVATYAANWIRHTERLETEHLSERFSEWLEYYGRHGIGRVGGGVITMRKRKDARNWFRADDGLETMLGPCGEQILQGFEARDFLEGLPDDAALLESRLILSPDVRLVHQRMPSGGEWLLEAAELHLARGFSRRGEIDPYMERLLIRCDGTRTLGSLAKEMAEGLGAEPGQVKSAVSGMAKQLLERGFLLPPRQGGEG